MPQQVEIVSYSGDALGWLKLSLVVNIALGLALLTVLVAVAVVHFWRGG